MNLMLIAFAIVGWAIALYFAWASGWWKDAERRRREFADELRERHHEWKRRAIDAEKIARPAVELAKLLMTAEYGGKAISVRVVPEPTDFEPGVQIRLGWSALCGVHSTTSRPFVGTTETDDPERFWRGAAMLLTQDLAAVARATAGDGHVWFTRLEGEDDWRAKERFRAEARRLAAAVYHAELGMIEHAPLRVKLEDPPEPPAWPDEPIESMVRGKWAAGLLSENFGVGTEISETATSAEGAPEE